MTGAEWEAGTNPMPMLDWLANRASERKMRLFAVMCCQRMWHLLRDERSRTAVEVAARFADGEACEEDLGAAAQMANEASREIVLARQLNDDVPQMLLMAAKAAGYTASPEVGCDAEVTKTIISVSRLAALDPGSVLGTRGDVNARSCVTLRDIFGNPFRPVTFSPEWRTSTAIALAQQMYDSRDFSAMPILADALQDAGCDNADILDHCRDEKATHVRGCWVVDLVLGKE